jgi:hypothetical protein
MHLAPPDRDARPRARICHAFEHHHLVAGGDRPAPGLRSAGGSMNAEVRRRIEMGTRALEFSRTHPDTEPGMQAAVST